MSRFAIDISKSKQVEKLIIKNWFLEKFLVFILFSMTILSLLFIGIMQFSSALNKNEPIALSFLLLISLIILSTFLFYSIIKLNSLKRVHGLSRGKNSSIIKKIAKTNSWNISSTNHQMTIIDFDCKDFGTDWGKQMTIIYDKKDILVNCISFGVYSTPSPVHWFANRKKVNKLKAEFKKEISNVSQQRIRPMAKLVKAINSPTKRLS